MKKEEVIAQLKTAKSAHADWLYKAKSLVNLKEGKENFAPINSHECIFGEWFYGDGQKLSALPNNPMECMNNIALLHQTIHEIYYNIYRTHYPEEIKKTFFSKFFAENKKVLTEFDTQFVLFEFKKLEALSAELLEELSRLERRIVAVSDEKIEALG